jgi:hypothetical protein
VYDGHFEVQSFKNLQEIVSSGLRRPGDGRSVEGSGNRTNARLCLLLDHLRGSWEKSTYLLEFESCHRPFEDDAKLPVLACSLQVHLLYHPAEVLELFVH